MRHRPNGRFIASSFSSNDGVTRRNSEYSGVFYECIWEGALDSTSGNSVTPLINFLLAAGIPIEGVTAKVTSGNSKFGSKLIAAVKAFQSSKGLLADGVVGPKTWTALGAEFYYPKSNCPKCAGQFPYGSKPPESCGSVEEPKTGGGRSGGGASGGGASGGGLPGTDIVPAKLPVTQQPWFWPVVAGGGLLAIASTILLVSRKKKK